MTGGLPLQFQPSSVPAGECPSLRDASVLACSVGAAGAAEIPAVEAPYPARVSGVDPLVASVSHLTRNFGDDVTVAAVAVVAAAPVAPAVASEAAAVALVRGGSSVVHSPNVAEHATGCPALPLPSQAVSALAELAVAMPPTLLDSYHLPMPVPCSCVLGRMQPVAEMHVERRGSREYPMDAAAPVPARACFGLMGHGDDNLCTLGAAAGHCRHQDDQLILEHSLCLDLGRW